MALPQQCIIAQNCHGLYCVPARSRQRPASLAVIDGGVWEPETVFLICTSVQAGDVIHAGTFFGDFLPAISKALAPAAKLWAFEPNSENFQSAQITCRLNDLRNVELRPCGLSDRPGYREMIVGQGETWLGGGSHILSRAATSEEHTERVAVQTIDDVVPPDRPVSVLHLDVEGHEAHALAGGQRTIRRYQPLVILETLPERWVQENLAPLGYRLLGRSNANYVLAVEKSTRPTASA